MYNFEYHKPQRLPDVQNLLQACEDPKIIAGGMSLLPALKQRLAQYSDLVDLGDVPELKGVQVEGDTIVIGATTPHAHVAAHPDVRRLIPALAVLAEGIGDPLVRNRGTIGGSLANSDPAADYPAGVLGLGAVLVTDRRTIAADDYFINLFETALEPNEIITAVRFPRPIKAGYAKFRHPASRFALVGVMAAVTATGVRVAVTGAGPCAFRFTQAESALSGRFDESALDGVVLDPTGLNADMHASAEYRANAVTVMTRRAVAAAH